MDNYYVDKPVFMVDLGSKLQVAGVVILTWQGAGQGMPNYTENGYNATYLQTR